MARLAIGESAWTPSRRQSANLARHLNQSYPDTVLFVARRAAGRPDAAAAALQAVDEAGLLLPVTTTGAVELVRVPPPAATGPDADVRARVRGLLRLTRVGAPDEPLTSLEQLRGQGPRQQGEGEGARRHGARSTGTEPIGFAARPHREDEERPPGR